MNPTPDPSQASVSTPRHFSPRVRESLIEKAARPDLHLWASLLARQRTALGLTADTQAARLGLDPDALCRFSLCRLPRPERRAEDVDVVARHVGLAVADLERLLAEDAGLGASAPTPTPADAHADAPKPPQGPKRLRLRRVEPGLYRSHDGRVEIRRDVSQQTRRADEICWVVVIDGRELPRAQDTKHDAVRVAVARPRQAGGGA